MYSEQDSIDVIRKKKEVIVSNSSDLKDVFANSWVIDMPCHDSKIGGDFLYVKQVKNKSIIAVIDSIGHSLEGVSAAISIYAMISFAVEGGITDPGDIITQMHRVAETTFKGEITCDLGIARWDSNINQLSYAGAKRRGYYSKKGGIVVIPSSRISIGQSGSDKHLVSTTTIDFGIGDRLYMATDGIESMINKNGKRLGTKNLRNWIEEINTFDICAQKELFQLKIDDWMHETERHDDIMIVGIEV